MTIAHFLLTLVVVVVCIWSRSTYVVVHECALGTYTKWLQNSHEFVCVHVCARVCIIMCVCNVYVCACVCVFLHRLFRQLTTRVAI